MAKAEYRSAVRSRRLISAALVDLLLKKPLDKITVTDVVTQAEVNRGTFYAHFVDIPAVLQHLIESTFSVLREALSSQEWPLSELPHVLLSQVQSLLEEDTKDSLCVSIKICSYRFPASVPERMLSSSSSLRRMRFMSFITLPTSVQY